MEGMEEGKAVGRAGVQRRNSIGEFPVGLQWRPSLCVTSPTMGVAPLLLRLGSDPPKTMR
jgi:hypothetical protein